jgi:hypothetical protein
MCLSFVGHHDLRWHASQTSTALGISMRVHRYFLLLSAWAIAAVTACGGGSDSEQRVDINYLAKYQGVWVEQCAMPINFSAGVFGPGSMRAKYSISAPDAAGKVFIEQAIDFFDSTLNCYDIATVPYATITAESSIGAVFSRLETLIASAGSGSFDVLTVNLPAGNVSAIGVGITSETVGGTAVWRITFSDGRVIDQDKSIPAATGELALLSATVNNVPNAEMTIYGAQQRYIKFR